MENKSFIGLIERCQSRDMGAFNAIFSKYERLIGFYAGRSGGEDVFQELALFLLELIYKIPVSRFKGCSDKDIERYIAVCIRNKYIALSKAISQRKKESFFLFESNADTACDLLSAAALRDALASLPEKQQMVIKLKYLYGYSDSELSLHFSVTRQAVNRLKNRAMKNLREYYLGEL